MICLRTVDAVATETISKRTNNAKMPAVICRALVVCRRSMDDARKMRRDGIMIREWTNVMNSIIVVAEEIRTISIRIRSVEIIVNDDSRQRIKPACPILDR